MGKVIRAWKDVKGRRARVRELTGLNSTEVQERVRKGYPQPKLLDQLSILPFYNGMCILFIMSMLVAMPTNLASGGDSLGS